MENKKAADVIKLKLFIPTEDLEAEGIAVLKKYGKVEEGIIREVLVPSSITLHALHYLINRAFGWQNSHLHKFFLPFEAYQKITGGTSAKKQGGHYATYDGLYMNWVKLCGVYFSFPFEDMKDFCWDDDYNGTVQFKTWLKRKYTGPYKFLGKREGYSVSRKAAMEVVKKNPKVLKCPPPEEFDKRKKTKKEYLPIEQASIYDVGNAFFEGADSLLERLPLSQLMRPRDDKDGDDLFKRVDELAKKQETSKETLPVIPITDELYYEYDFGDGWIVVIQAEEFYNVEEKNVTCNNKKVDEELAEKIIAVSEKLKPVCIGLDGLPVMDDVGGLWGYIDFLQNIHEGDKEDREESKEWAKDMGWSGKMPKAATLL